MNIEMRELIIKLLCVVLGVVICLGVINMAKGLDISSSVQGDGKWDMTTSDGNLLVHGGGDGSIAFAQSIHMVDNKAIAKASIDFDGVRGTWGAKGNIGPVYDMKLSNATSMRLTTEIDAMTEEESTGAIIAKVPVYFATLKGNATGSMSEFITDMSKGRMGRTLELSTVKGMGTFKINTTMRL